MRRPPYFGRRMRRPYSSPRSATDMSCLKHMRLLLYATLLAVGFGGGVAFAAPEAGKGKGGEIGGAGGSGGGLGGGGAASEGGQNAGSLTARNVLDNASICGLFDKGCKGKPFDVGASWETHALLWRDQAGTNGLFNYAYAYA